jgi:endogenous inhibitor of DNA gyrase (YacG/DUF329 family)
MTKSTTNPNKGVKQSSSTDALFDTDQNYEPISTRPSELQELSKLMGSPPEPAPTLVEVQQSVLKTAVTIDDLSIAWEKLEKVLTQPVRISISAVADSLKMPKWQLVLGLLNHLHQSATLNCPVIDPSWKDADQMLLIGQEVKCPECGVMYVQQWPRQVYCSSKCGNEVNGRLARERKRIAKEQAMEADRIGEEQIAEIIARQGLKGDQTGVQF